MARRNEMELKGSKGLRVLLFCWVDETAPCLLCPVEHAARSTVQYCRRLALKFAQSNSRGQGQTGQTANRTRAGVHHGRQYYTVLYYQACPIPDTGTTVSNSTVR